MGEYAVITALEKYKKRSDRYNLLLKKQLKGIINISNLRLVIFVLVLAILIETYILKRFYLFEIVILIATVLFCYLAHLQKNAEIRKKYTTVLCEINGTSIKRLNGEWIHFEDTGEDFIDENHNFSYDLDIFGTGSLFQWINVAYTYIGRQRLKEILTEKPQNEQNIYDRQSAVKELEQKIYFRQRLGVEGKIICNNKHNPKELFLWIKKRSNYILKKQVIWFLRFLSMVTAITTLTLVVRIIYYIISAFFDSNKSAPKIFYLIPYYIPVFLIMIQCVILRIKREDRIENLNIAEKYNDDIKTYKNMLRHIERYKFKSEYIVNLCKKLYDNEGRSASKQIGNFSRICESIADRRNMLYPILNSIFMIEFYWTISIEKWKINSGNDFEGWINTIGELEALCSIAVIKYDNPHWSMPNIVNGSSKIIARNIGHPLLGEKRVCNNLKVEAPHSVMLITGSNMSGKSTFMRTVGVNIVLAYAGAPVCADQFCCTIMDFYSCMRVSDNLGQNISSFYAEILKIKNIVKASKEGKQVLFLLDEIFKGTNSKDRHTGAMILVKQLSKTGNLGFISTHDLELGEMENHRNSKVKNYYFSEYYKENEIYFDYKLKIGVSPTRNAIYLMKLAGIEVEEINDIK